MIVAQKPLFAALEQRAGPASMPAPPVNRMHETFSFDRAQIITIERPRTIPQ
jgi:hypothetical protein